MNLRQSRLKYSEFTLSEIANEMYFTDESRLNKISKNLNGKTTKQYKKELVHQILVTKKIDNIKAI